MTKRVGNLETVGGPAARSPEPGWLPVAGLMHHAHFPRFSFIHVQYDEMTVSVSDSSNIE
jgi:hypothetical protein